MSQVWQEGDHALPGAGMWQSSSSAGNPRELLCVCGVPSAGPFPPGSIPSLEQPSIAIPGSLLC